MDWKTCAVARWEAECVGMIGTWGVKCKILHLEWVSNAILIYNMGKCIYSHFWTRSMSMWEKECIDTYICFTLLSNSNWAWWISCNGNSKWCKTPQITSSLLTREGAWVHMTASQAKIRWCDSVEPVKIFSYVTCALKELLEVYESISLLTSLLLSSFFCAHLWFADTAFSPVLCNTMLVLKPLCHQRCCTMSDYMKALSILYLRYSAGTYICIYWFLYQLSTIFSISIFIYKFTWVPIGTLLSCLARVWVPNSAIASATEGMEGTPWDHSWWYQQTLLSSSELAPTEKTGSSRKAGSWKKKKRKERKAGRKFH